jgi:DNA-binding NarL/FixJ family response regulator
MQEDDLDILVVDDDEAFGCLIETMLAWAGFRCRTVASGEAALAAIDTKQPLVIVLDVYLPEISGYDVCRNVRERYGYNVGVIFISGERTEALDRVAGLELGGDDYLAKPFDQGELVARVRTLVRRMQRGPNEKPGKQTTQALTRREAEVLALIAAGDRQKEIARTLSISPKTVGTHIGHIFEKLGVHTQGQAIATAYRLHIIDHAPGRMSRSPWILGVAPVMDSPVPLAAARRPVKA